jgi:hypothetical protein
LLLSNGADVTELTRDKVQALPFNIRGGL